MGKLKPEYRRAIRYKWILGMLFGSEFVARERETRSDYFDEKAIALPEHFNGATLLFGGKDDNVDIFFTDVTWDCLPPSFDARYVMVVSEHLGHRPGYADIQFGRFRKASIKEVRGLGRLVSDRVVELSFAGIFDRQLRTAKRFYAHTPDGGWFRLGVNSPDVGNNRWDQALFPGQSAHERVDSRDGVDGYDHLQLGMSFAFTDHYTWKVLFRNNQNHSIALAVHPKQIRNLFRLRESETDRRKALKHLVRGHWRSFDHDDVFDIQTYVREHLRGQLTFRWFDFYCEILIPPALKQTIQRAKVDRELMRMEVPRRDRRKLFASAAR